MRRITVGQYQIDIYDTWQSWRIGVGFRGGHLDIDWWYDRAARRYRKWFPLEISIVRWKV